MAKDKLLILDLDETLIYAAETPLERRADFRVGRFQIYKRPHLEAFLTACFSWFDVAVWTSASPGYARGIVKAIFPASALPIFVWASDRCTRVYDPESGEYYWRKSLKKVQREGYSKESIIAIDDTPQKWEQSYGNLVPVSPYEGDAEDNELVRLIIYLDHLRHEPNVRQIEKRAWRRN